MHMTNRTQQVVWVKETLRGIPPGRVLHFTGQRLHTALGKPRRAVMLVGEQILVQPPS
jgi:hypothetical protein